MGKDVMVMDRPSGASINVGKVIAGGLLCGLLINISEIKERVGKVLRDGFDHKFLNQDNPSFREVPPTAENVARQLYCYVSSLFSDVGAKLCACHLNESPERSATYYFTGACEVNYWFGFSAARRTLSPHLSQEENARLFGFATAPHGHNYGCRLTFRAEQLDPKRPLVRYDEKSRNHSHLQFIECRLDRPV